LPHIRLQLAVFPLLAVLSLAQPGMQSGTRASFPPIDEAQAPPALIRSIRIVPTKDGPAVEIITTRPLTPEITTLDNPERIVIDLPKTYIPSRQRFALPDKRVIERVRVDQFRKDPPVVRVVLDLAQPESHTWDAAGNRLMVRLGPKEENSPEQGGTPVVAQGVAPALVSGSTGTTGTVLPAGGIATGSAVSAGADTAVLRLAHGGEVRICPGTTISLTASRNGHDLMLAMNTGALETHYHLDASADSILTPDFRILLTGPGEFDYAISADSRGNTCVRTLPGNTAPAIVSELMGDGVYHVKPSEEVVFRGGQLKRIDSRIPEDCGCPAPSIPVLRTSAAPLPPASRANPSPATRPQPADAQACPPRSATTFTCR
jgi:AMIN domain